MITKFQLFENIKRFDYVILNPKNERIKEEYPELYQFLTETIGMCASVVRAADYCCITFDNVPEKLTQYFQKLDLYYKYFKKDEIDYYSNNKEELEKILETLLAARKYNL